MLEDLLTIKRRREDDAAAVVGEARRAVERQREACKTRRTALDEYNVWQEAEKLRLYEEVYRKSVTRAKLEGYRERTGLLRQRQLRLEEELDKAERDLQAAEAELQEAKRKAPRRPQAGREVRGVSGGTRGGAKARSGTQGGGRGGGHCPPPILTFGTYRLPRYPCANLRSTVPLLLEGVRTP